MTYEGWWEGLRAGRVVVTNGPLLRPRVNGELPGHVFRSQSGEVIELTVQLNLAAARSRRLSGSRAERQGRAGSAAGGVSRPARELCRP